MNNVLWLSNPIVTLLFVLILGTKPKKFWRGMGAPTTIQVYVLIQNSLSVLFTERPAIGILLPNVVFDEELYDYVWTLWSNSTLGLLCYWMHCNKQHSGRGRIFIKGLKSMPTLDMRELGEEALWSAKRIFGDMKYKKMLPFNQMDEDEVRQNLDRLLLSDVLGFDEDTHPGSPRWVTYSPRASVCGTEYTRWEEVEGCFVKEAHI